MQLSEQEIVRRENLQKIKDLGIDPFPADEFLVNITSTEIKDQYNDAEEEKDRNLQSVSVAGRIMMKRVMGKAAFAEVQDAAGRIQIYLKRDEICPGENKDLYNGLFKKLLDIGDYVGVKGYVFKTKMGETSIHVTHLLDLLLRITIR